jgi:DHA1 family bicyclomycin/chloramphenicol resistance-like MFS transporter
MTQSTASVRLVVILGAVSAFAPLSIDMYLPAFTTIAREFSAPPESVQLTVSAFFVGLAVGQFFYGPLSDHFGRRPPLAAGLVLYILASAGCALAPDVRTLILMRALQAFGGCSGVIIATAMVRDLFQPQQGARVLSRLVLVIGVAPIVAPTVGAYIVKFADWRTIFWLMAAFGVACLIATGYLLPETRPRRSGTVLALRPVVRDYALLLTERRFMGYAFAVALAHASILAYVTAAPFVLIQVYGIAPTTFGLLFALNACALILAAQWNAHLLRTHSPDWLLTRTNLLPPILGALLFVVAATRVGGLAALMTLLFIYLSTMSIVRPNATASALADHADRAGTANSLIGCLQFTFATLAGAFMSLIHDGTAKPMALTMTLLSLAGLALQRRLTRPVAPAA